MNSSSPQIRITCRCNDECYASLLPDETVTSWVRRHPFVRFDPQVDRAEECDFGELQTCLPGASPALVANLKRSALPPDKWLLQPHQRTLLCARCVAEDWALGRPPYPRRGWAVAWRTCCPKHGELFDVDVGPLPSWPKIISMPAWSGRYIGIPGKRGHRSAFVIPLYGDQRAIHLESALSHGASARGWSPKGLDETRLRATYRQIVADLLRQFHFDKDEPGNLFPSSVFNQERNFIRFSINAMAEAILSEWTKTPLPPSAPSRRRRPPAFSSSRV